MNMLKTRKNGYPEMMEPMKYGPIEMGYDSKEPLEPMKKTSPSMASRMPMTPVYSEPEYEESHHPIGAYSHEPRDCRGVYAAINARQLTALMFHSEMADLFAFLTLKGFQDMHEYQYLVESAGYRAVRNYYMTQYGKLLQEDDPHPIDVFPEDWYRYKRSDVTPEIRRQAVQVALEQYLDWEKETKDRYTQYASLLMSWTKTADHAKVSKMIHEVDEEIKNLERMHADFKSTRFSMDHIMSTQTKLTRKYENRFLGLGDTRI